MELSDAYVAARTSGAQAPRAVQQGLNQESAEIQQEEEADIFGAGVPSTGAGGTALFALIGAMLASLAYAGYTRSGRFHRQQALDAASQRDPMDFRA